MKIARLLRASVALASALIESAAAAQSSDEIVVVGHASNAAAIQKLAKSISVDTQGQIARFADGICASSVGLPDPYDQIVVLRIEANARAAGLPIARPGCTPNLQLLVVDDGKALVASIDHDQPVLLSALAEPERQRLLKEHGPVRAWSLTRTTGADGTEMTLGRSSGVRAPELRLNQATLIGLPTRQEISASIVVIDAQATIGKTLTQIADYATMRALVRTDVMRVRPNDDTILSLFTPDASTPARLTPFDATYLQALYRSDPGATSGHAIRAAASKVSRFHPKGTRE